MNKKIIFVIKVMSGGGAERVISILSHALVEKKFEGSLPAFLAAFTKRQDVSEDTLDALQAMIDRARGERK